MPKLVTESLDPSQLLQLTFLQQPDKESKTSETMFSFYIILALFSKKSDPTTCSIHPAGQRSFSVRPPALLLSNHIFPPLSSCSAMSSQH